MAVSYDLAQLRQQWHSEMNTRRGNNQTPPYDFERLCHRLRFLHEVQETWKVLLKNIAPENILSMTYQNLSQDFTNTIQATNRFLGVHDVEVPPESITKQSSPEKTAMVERFKEECRIKEPWVFDVDYSINAGTTL
jgi:LPS sulfotransferase NodH